MIWLKRRCLLSAPWTPSPRGWGTSCTGCRSPRSSANLRTSWRGLFDTNFNTLCESESTPLHIGSLPGIQETLQGGKWHDGDVVIHNYPYCGSSHSPDIAMVIPVFHKGQLVAYSANTAHHLDIGAATPGLIIDILDVYAEGMLFASTKLYEEGHRNEALVGVWWGGSMASPQACRSGVRRSGRIRHRG